MPAAQSALEQHSPWAQIPLQQCQPLEPQSASLVHAAQVLPRHACPPLQTVPAQQLPALQVPLQHLELIPHWESFVHFRHT